MPRSIVASLLLACVLIGCASPEHAESLSTKSWNFDLWGQLAKVSVIDIADAVSAAKQSKELFDHRKVYAVRVVTRNEIDVYFYPPDGIGGVFVVVVREHGHWRETHSMFFSP